MKREEYIEEEYNRQGLMVDFDVEKFINRIFDDFESRTCDGCSYYSEYTYEIPGAEDFTNTELGCTLILHPFPITHYCNQWNAKEGEA